MLRITVILLFLAFLPLNAQVSIGLGGTLSSIGISGDAPSGSSWAARFGYGAFVAAELDLTHDVSLTLQPGLQTRSASLQYTYSTGTALNPSDTTVDSVHVNTSYIAIPLGVRIYSDSHRWFFSTGFSVQLLQSVEIDTLTGSYEPDNIIKSVDASFIVGVGHRIPLDPFSINLELRYQQGLLDLIGDDQVETFAEAPTIRMSGLGLSASFEWRVGQ